VESLDLKDIRVRDGDDYSETLWAYTAQCNVTGSRLGLGLTKELKCRSNAAVLVYAAGYLSTSVLDLDSIPYEEALDFIAYSFYKIYVRPHCSAISVLITPYSGPANRPWGPDCRTNFLAPTRSPGHSYFGGGTIDALSVSSPFWSHPRSTTHSLSSRFELGTLPFPSIIALDHVMRTHYRLFGWQSNVSKHTAFVAGFARDRLSLCSLSRKWSSILYDYTSLSTSLQVLHFY
jgi:molybdenum cofactor sulfurtransferase